MRTSSRILVVSSWVLLSNCSIGGLPADQTGGAGGLGGSNAGGSAGSTTAGKGGSSAGSGGASAGSTASGGANTGGEAAIAGTGGDAGSGGTDTGSAGTGGAADAGSGGMDSGGEAGAPSGGANPGSGGSSAGGSANPASGGKSAGAGGANTGAGGASAGGGGLPAAGAGGSGNGGSSNGGGGGVVSANGGTAGTGGASCSGQLVALEPSVANTSDTITLEGTFCGTTNVTFPGNAQATATLLGTNRATVKVPAGATAGDLTVTTNGVTTSAVPFRRASFALGLQQFQAFDDQTNGPRQMPSLVTGRSSAAAVTAGGYVYVIGGLSSTSTSLKTVERAPVYADGSLGPFSAVTGSTLTVPRHYVAAVVIGGYVYVVSGCSTGDARVTSVERAVINSDGSLGAFSVVPGVSLGTARCNYSLSVVGDSLYVFGGTSSNGTDEPTVERARIAANGSLGNFATTGVTLNTPRDAFATAVTGSYLYALGGYSAAGATFLSSVERAPISGNGDLGAFAVVPATVLTTPRSGPVISLGGWLYLYGGNLGSVERAAIASDGTLGGFATVPGISVTPGGAVVPPLGNYLHVIGGQSGNLSAVQRASINGSGQLDTTALGTSSFTQPHSSAQAIVGGNYYAFGGSYQAAGEIVDQAAIGPNGALGAFSASASKLSVHLARQSTALIGNYVYQFGGASAAATPAITGIQRATIQANGSLGNFADAGVTLNTGRASHGTAVIGGYVYTLGGFYGAATTSVERAPINADGTLGTSSLVSGVSLSTAHTDFNVAVLGKYFYVLGGENSGESAALTGIDRVALNSDGTLNGNFTQSNTFVNARFYAQPAVIGGYLYVLGGDTGHTVERAVINPDGSLGTFAVVSGLSVTSLNTFGFVAGNTLTSCGNSSCTQMNLP